MQVLKEAVHACASFHERGLLVGVAVNVPPSIVVDERLPLAVDAMLVSAGLAPHWLTLELTEGSALPDFEKARFVLDVLAEMRVRLSLDDFGTGYAFVEELHQLPFDEVKIDRSFVGRAVTSPEAAAIVRFTIQLSHALGKRIVAEGVESAETVHLLHRLGADAIQGFVVSPPIDATELLDTFGDISARARELVETRARTITLDRAGG
jgi:EAL domain-containing protein (putative c-di-GMP-specific phosphodiesterase class I)